MTARAAWLGAIATCLVACDRPPAGPQPLAPPQRVVLVTLDTVRADHLGAYGYPRATSPFIDSLADRGVVFANAYATSASTAPAHASLFTSRYPLEHGLRRNTIWLPSGTPTLAGAFTAAGWRTAAFVSATVLDEITRIGQGFAHYHETTRPDGRLYQDAAVTTDRALAWLRDVPADAPVFLWVHYFDAHAPYAPPAAAQALVGPQDDTERGQWADWLRTHHFIAPRRPDLDQIAGYDAEIRAIDEQIARLYQQVERRPGTGLWVITADHGEGLSNHEFWGHVIELYTEAVRVPLIIHWTPDGPSQRRTVTPLVSHVDVAPTLLDLAGLPADALPRPEGRTLRHHLDGTDTPSEPDRVVFAQYGGEHDRCEDLFAAYTAEFALISSLTSTRERFYALADDPYQVLNRSETGVAAQDLLRDELRTWVTRMVDESGGYDDRTVIRDRPALERLRALGYVP